ASLLGMALVLGACGGDDKKSGGGGGGPSYAPPPTARPSLTGLSVLIDASGGNASGGVGGNGGSIDIYAQYGAMIEGTGPGRATINANILSAASLANNTVTAAELLADLGIFGTSSGTTLLIDLFAHDFWLPSGATLDLSGLTVGGTDSVVLRTHGRNNYIRLDGNVILTRAGGASVSLALESLGA
ncbi:MAG: hypothetical protein KJ044_15075, partial [Planctomycetes bacterium]|nr:hypothetical protein [Planctomycetota bacterium]